MKINRTTQRTIEILDLIASSQDGLTLNEIAKELNMPKTSAFDILETLVQLNMLYIKEQRLKTYAIGVKAYAIGNMYSKTSLLLNSAGPIMKRLSQEIGTTTLLAKENNGSLLYTLKHEPAKKIIATPEVGEVAYLHSTSIGKAILAFSKHQLELIDQLDLYPMTKRTITSKKALTQELLIIKERGYAIANRENEEYTYAIAAPIFDYHGVVSSAIGVVHLYKEEYQAEEDIKKVVEAAKEISSLLGYRE